MGEVARLGLRAKILLIAVAVTLLSLGAVLAISSHIFADAYLSALQSRSGAIAQGLRLQMERILQLGIQIENLSGFDKQCKTVSDSYPGIDFAWIASPDGTILFSSDTARHGQTITDAGLLRAVGKGSEATVEYSLDGQAGYGSILPIVSRDDSHVGSVVIGLSARVLDEKEREMRAAFVGVGLLALVIGTVVLVAGLSHFISEPLRQLIGSIQRIGTNTGDLGQRIALNARDELGTLARSFNGLMQSLQDTTVTKSSLEAAYAELERYRNHLEELVRARTHELDDRTQQLDAIFSLSPDGFVSFDAQRCVRFVNQAFLRMAGMTADEVIGLDEVAFAACLQQRSSPGSAFPDIALLRAVQQRDAANGPNGKAGEGRRRLFELAGPARRILEVDLRLAAADNVSQILYFRDVTRETEVDRMKSEFLSHAAHELRTPMASIYGYAELLLMQDFDEAMRRELLTTIYNQAELITSITNELLDLARIEARRGKDFVIERILLAEVVGEVVKCYKLPAGRTPPLLDLSAVPLFVDADRKKLQQAISNVVSNAYKYSPHGGDVTISLRRREAEGTAGMVGVEVRDHGLGMTPEQLGHVFERFYRADTSGKIPGSGLGMSIVKEIIELHGGSIDLASKLGSGTTATLWMPLAADLH